MRGNLRKLRQGSLTALVLILTITATCAGAKVLTLQVDNRALFTAWTKGVIERFEKEYPDLKVDLWVPTGNLLEQITVRIAAGMPFDIGLHDPYAILDFARQGILEDLSPYVRRDAAHFENWYPPALEMTRFRGALYSLPRDLQFYGVYYNVDAYAEVGLASRDRLDLRSPGLGFQTPGQTGRRWQHPTIRVYAPQMAKLGHSGLGLRWRFCRQLDRSHAFHRVRRKHPAGPELLARVCGDGGHDPDQSTCKRA